MRKELEQKLTELALHGGSKSNEEMATALLSLWRQFQYLHLEATLRAPFEKAEADLKAQLQARLAELQSQSAQSIEAPTSTPPVHSSTAITTATVPPATEEPKLVPIPEQKIVHTLAFEEEAPEAPAQDLESVEETEATAQEWASQPNTEEVDAPAPAPTSAPIPVESVADRAQHSDKRSLNDRFAQNVLKFGLNDRIGFVKELFEGSQEDFNRVVSQLNTLNNLQEANDFLNTHIAPEYNWDAKEETAARFMAAVEQRFS
jgi:hypothetical protein